MNSSYHFETKNVCTWTLTYNTNQTPINEGHEMQFQIFRFCFSGLVYKVCKVFCTKRSFSSISLVPDRQTRIVRNTPPWLHRPMTHVKGCVEECDVIIVPIWNLGVSEGFKRIINIQTGKLVLKLALKLLSFTAE